MAAPTHPEFPASVETLIAEAVLDLLQADAALSAFVGGRFEPIELEDLRLLGSVTLPAIWVALLESREESQGSGVSTLKTMLSLILATDGTEPMGNRGWLRIRVFEHIKGLLVANPCLYTPEGEQVTDGITEFQTIRPGQLKTNAAILLSPLNVLFTSSVKFLERGLL